MNDSFLLPLGPDSGFRFERTGCRENPLAVTFLPPRYLALTNGFSDERMNSFLMNVSKEDARQLTEFLKPQ